MRNHCTPRKCSRSCPHHFPTLIPNLLPYVGWAIVGSQCIQCVSDLLNEAPKVQIKLWKTAAYFTYNSNSQKNFRQERCTSRQIQMLIAALENSKFSSQDIYLLYIDFTNTFGSIDHTRLLAIMVDLGYPLDAVKLIGNIYANSHTTLLAHTSQKLNQFQSHGAQYKVTPSAHTSSLYF